MPVDELLFLLNGNPGAEAPGFVVGGSIIPQWLFADCQGCF